MMKSVHVLYIFGLTCLIFAFTPILPNKNNELLVKKWKPIEILLGEKLETKFPENAFLEFKKDKLYFLDGKEQGTWELDKTGKILSFKGGDFGEKEKFDGKWQVDKLSKTELELSTVFTQMKIEDMESPKVRVKLVVIE